jgi:hypothetical protein
MIITDRLGNIRTLSDQFNNAYAKFYNLSECLSVDEIITFNGRVIFKKYIPKKHNTFI